LGGLGKHLKVPQDGVLSPTVGEERTPPLDGIGRDAANTVLDVLQIDAVVFQIKSPPRQP
jgi:hypothetical protein